MLLEYYVDQQLHRSMKVAHHVADHNLHAVLYRHDMYQQQIDHKHRIVVVVLAHTDQEYPLHAVVVVDIVNNRMDVAVLAEARCNVVVAVAVLVVRLLHTVRALVVIALVDVVPVEVHDVVDVVDVVHRYQRSCAQMTVDVHSPMMMRVAHRMAKQIHLDFVAHAVA